MISNVVVSVSRFSGLKHPTKERPENKIDGPVAMLMALGRAMQLQTTERSWWETSDTPDTAEAGATA
jgi:phage terminase large subunit-like protein